MTEGYKDTEIGIFPKTWSVMHLGEFANIHNNKRYPISSEIRINKKGIFPYCGANGIVDFIDEYKFDGEFILMAEDGGNFHDYQTKPIAYLMQGKFWVNNHAHVLSAKNGVNKFLFYSLEHKDITKYIIGSTRTKLNRSVLESILIAVPPLPEQQKIAEILSTIDEKIEVIEAQINQTTALKKGLMQQLLTKGIGHTKFKDSPLGKIPESWEVVKLEDVIEKIVGGGTPSRDNLSYWNGNIPWATVKDLKKTIIDETEEYITNEGLKNSASNLISKNTLVIATRMALGKAVFFTKDVAINQDLKAVFTKENALSKFLFYWFLNSSDLLQSIGSGSTVKGLRLEQLKSLPLLLPPLNEQNKISNMLFSIDEKLNNLECKRKGFISFKKGLMQQLLTGKLRVNLNPSNHATKSEDLQTTT